MNRQTERKRRAAWMVTAYPFVLILIGVLLNVLVFGTEPIVPAAPSPGALVAVIIAGALLVGNHTWLMTSTELTRVRFDMAATPEEWDEKGTDRTAIPQSALDELTRRHNAHRNTTENVVYFVLLAMVLIMVSPPDLAVQIWTIGFGVTRLGYTYSYLNARTGMRGLFMSLSLLSLYGMAGYLILAALT